MRTQLPKAVAFCFYSYLCTNPHDYADENHSHGDALALPFPSRGGPGAPLLQPASHAHRPGRKRFRRRYRPGGGREILHVLHGRRRLGVGGPAELGFPSRPGRPGGPGHRQVQRQVLPFGQQRQPVRVRQPVGTFQGPGPVQGDRPGGTGLERRFRHQDLCR